MHDSRSRASASDWLAGARPHTWANAFAPVIAGTGAAASTGQASLPRAVLAGVVAWALIIGVNYANDYSDGIRGTDDDRSGPTRLTASGLAAPRSVKYAAFFSFGVAAVAGIALSLMSAWWLILVGAACILGAWFYTGGAHPYGYRGLGEVSVFVFFGLVAVLGTQYTQAGMITVGGVVLAVCVGALSCAVNLANNLRDIPTDSATGKITLAVRLGDRHSRHLWMILAATPVLGAVVLAITVTPLALLTLGTVPFVARAAAPIRSGATGAALIPVLGFTGRAMLVFSGLAAVTLAFGA